MGVRYTGKVRAGALLPRLRSGAVTQIEVYRHSGRLDPMAVPVALVVGTGVGIGLGWVYQAFVDWVPLMYVNALATVFFALGVGLSTGKALRRWNCRSAVAATTIAILVAAASDAATFYFAYERAVSEVAQRKSMPVDEVRRRVPLTRYLSERAKKGWNVGHGSSGLPVTGVFVYLIWAIEAGLVLGITAYTAVEVIASPFCEDCEKWTESETLGRKVGHFAEDLERIAREGPLDALLALRPGPELGPAAVDYSIHSCAECLQRHYVTITKRWTERGPKGEVLEKSKTLLAQAIVTQKQIDKLRDSLKPMHPMDEA
jgi:hypothetical protein